MALPPNFLDELRARTPLPALIARSVRLLRSGREWKGCCPFHGEKTPSFYVYDDHFHCFGCGAHGDAIAYVMKSQGASFIEAVEGLAAEAGLAVPKPSPEAAEAEQKRHSLSEVLEAAAAAFQRRLFLPEGAAGLAYLRGRGLADETIRSFGLGWSGEGRGAVAADLARENIDRDMLIEAGLMKQGERGPVDMFFNRVMFPIRDRQGRCISFGGRILGDGQPKYVNGPESPVFSKRRALYGLDRAREPVRKGGRLLVVEGYMDVIALADAGLAAVAPLGTALTEEQAGALWRLTPEPILCFDGDAAGRRAALRAAELVLPKLTPERSVRLLRLPDGEDPDSLVRKRGAGAMAALADGAERLTAVLFDLLAEGFDRSSAEGRASLRKRLGTVAAAIEDKDMAGEVRRLLLDRFFQEGRPPRREARGEGGRFPPRKPPPRIPQRIAVNPAEAAGRRARLLVAILLAHPVLIPSVEESLCTIDLPPPCDALNEGFQSFIAEGKPLDSDTLLAHLDQSGLAAAAREILDEVPDVLAPGAPLPDVADGWWELFGLMPSSLDSLRQQKEELLHLYRQKPDDPATVDRVTKLINALRRAERGERDDA